MNTMSCSATLRCAHGTRICGFRPPRDCALPPPATLLPPKVALRRCVLSLLCAHCSRQRRGGCGGGWRTRRKRQLGPASACLSGSPRRQLPLACRGQISCLAGAAYASAMGPAENKKAKLSLGNLGRARTQAALCCGLEAGDLSLGCN